MKKLQITIQTNNKTQEFKDLLLELVQQGHSVTVKPFTPKPNQCPALSHEQVDLLNIIK